MYQVVRGNLQISFVLIKVAMFRIVRYLRSFVTKKEKNNSDDESMEMMSSTIFTILFG